MTTADFTSMTLEYFDAAELVRRMVKDKYTFKEIGDALGLSRHAAKRYAVKLGVYRANARNIVAPRIRELVLAGRDPRQIVAVTACHSSQVYQQRRDLVAQGFEIAPLPPYSRRAMTLRVRWGGRTYVGPKGMRYRKIQQVARQRNYIAVSAPLDESQLFGSSLKTELALIELLGRVDGSADDWRGACVKFECLRFDR